MRSHSLQASVVFSDPYIIPQIFSFVKYFFQKFFKNFFEVLSTWKIVWVVVLRRPLYYTTKVSVCQVLFRKFFKKLFPKLFTYFLAVLSSRTAYILYHFLSVLSIPFFVFFSLLLIHTPFKLNLCHQGMHFSQADPAIYASCE